MPTNLPPVSPQLPFVYVLDQKETALADLTAFNLSHISLVVLGTPPNCDHLMALINDFCSSAEAPENLRALWIQEGDIYDSIREDLQTLLHDALPQEPFDQIRAFTTVANSDIPFEALKKGSFSFGPIMIKRAINEAIQHSDTSQA